MQSGESAANIYSNVDARIDHTTAAIINAILAESAVKFPPVVIEMFPPVPMCRISVHRNLNEQTKLAEWKRCVYVNVMLRVVYRSACCELQTSHRAASEVTRW